jgi:two-component system response regulator FlrC
LVDREHVELDPPDLRRLVPTTIAGATVSAPAADGALADQVGAIDDGRSALARRRELAEREILLSALRDQARSRNEVALRLGISPRTLRYKLARLRAAGIEVPAA